MEMLWQEIMAAVQKIEEKTIYFRRDLHKYPESGWTEFRTASLVVQKLRDIGYDVAFGAAAVDETTMMGVPSAELLAEHQVRAIAQGADAAIVNQMIGGKTGVVGTMYFSDGPVVALRFDMDANDVVEADGDNHRPVREGFRSFNHGCMHACGHDGHTAIGLAVAEVLARFKDRLRGTVKLIFQPAEEGVRGAKSMVEKGVVDDVDYFLAGHLMEQPTGYLAYDMAGFFATSKFDVHFSGKPAHAGATPERGKNAVLAAAVATVNLHAVSRHSGGASRLNVGVIRGGTSRNVIAADSVLQIETRGETSTINQFMCDSAERIVQSAAAMYENDVEIRPVGNALGCKNSSEFSEKIGKIAAELNIFNKLEKLGNVGGSEDCSYFMERVQSRGGQAAYLLLGAGIAATHHNAYFDFDEQSMMVAAKLYSVITAMILTEKL